MAPYIHCDRVPLVVKTLVWDGKEQCCVLEGLIHDHTKQRWQMLLDESRLITSIGELQTKEAVKNSINRYICSHYDAHTVHRPKTPTLC